MDIQVINSIVTDIKKKTKKCVTNYYLNLKDNTLEIGYYCHKENGIVFTVLECDKERGYFFGEKGVVLELLKQMPTNTIMDCITKDEEEYQWILDANWKHHMTLERYVNTDLIATVNSNEKTDSLVQEKILFAEISNSEELLCTLHENFEVVSAHFLSKEELEEAIRDKSVWYCKEESKIVSLVVCTYEGKKILFNYLYNHSVDVRGRELVLNFMKYAIERGVNYSYLWVDKSYKKAIQLHRSMNFHADGLKNVIYVKK